MIEYCSRCGGTVADGEHVGECELPVCDQCGEPFFRSEGRFWVNDLICPDCWNDARSFVCPLCGAIAIHGEQVGSYFVCLDCVDVVSSTGCKPAAKA